MGGTAGIRAGIMAVCALALMVACGGGENPGVTPAVPTLAEPAGAGQVSMGGAALGGNAETMVLAQVKLDAVPYGPLAWVTRRLELEAGETLFLSGIGPSWQENQGVLHSDMPGLIPGYWGGDLWLERRSYASRIWTPISDNWWRNKPRRAWM